MARKTTRSVGSNSDTTDRTEDQDDQEFDETIAAEVRQQTMSKAGAARAALASGIMLPREASAYIKQKYGIDISPQQFSAEKSRLKLRSVGSVPFSSSSSSGYAGEGFANSNQSFPGDADVLQALEIMKPLIHQLGAEKVKRIVDLLR